MKGQAHGWNRGAQWRLALACAAALALIVAAGAAGDGPSRFGLRSASTATVTTASGPESVQFADMNGDRKMDMVVASNNDGTTGKIQVFLGNGKGGFTQKSEVDAGAGGPVAFVHDVNGDGKPDVVGLNYNDSTIETYLNDGTGVIAEHGAPVATGGQPTGVAFGDWNGDQKTDIAVVDGFPSNLQFLLGDGSGGFVESQHVQPDGDFSAGPSNAVVHDFNGDGKDDVAVLNTFDSDIQIWLSNDDGSFTASPTRFSVAGLNPGWLYLVDTNGDGKLDFVASGGNGLATLLGDGSGGFAAPIVSPGPSTFGAPVDINGDKKVDFYGIDYGSDDDTVAIFVGNGLGAFAASPVEYSVNAGATPGALWLDTADVNGDKTPDVAVTNDGSDTVSILLWTSSLPPAPTVSKISPAAQVVGGTITLTGKNFGSVAGVSFGGPLGTIQSSTSTSIVVDVPTGAKYGKLSLVWEKGVVTTGVTFAPILQPSVTTISPAGAQKPGGMVTITGTHFSGVDTVTIGGTALTSLKVTETKITGVIPLSKAGGPYTLEVHDAAGVDDEDYGVAVRPTIASFTPAHGPANTTRTTNVHVSDPGGSLLGVNTVLFNGKAGKNVSVSVDGQSLTADAPAGATTGTITVKNAVGQTASLSDFTVDPQPKITTLSATSGTSGATIQINGSNLIGITDVTFGGVDGTNLDVSGAPAFVTAQVPDGAATGPVVVTGTNGTATSGQTFTPHEAPTVSSFSPSIGALPGAKITVTGLHFKGVTGVFFNGGAAGVFKILSDTSLTVTIPTANASSGPMTITNPYGSATPNYYVIEAPTGLSFTPAATGFGFGATVRINGQHLGGVTSVTFNGIAAASFTVTADNQITATPAASTGKGVVSVTNAAGTFTTVAQFTLVSITSFSPSTAGPGDTITVNGSGLDTITEIQLPGVALVAPATQSATQLTITVPSCGSNTSGAVSLYMPSAIPLTNYVQTATTIAISGLTACP